MPASLSEQQEMRMQVEEEEDDLDHLLVDVQEPVLSKPKLNRLKRARATDKATEVPANKRCEIEDAAAAPASPSCYAAEASHENSPAPSAFRGSDAEEADEEGRAIAKSASAERQQQSEDDAAEDYWDEEDELEEYVMRRNLGQIKDDDGEGSSSDSDSGGSAPSNKGGDKDGADSDDGAVDTKQLAAETQRILRDAARSDRIGKGAAPEIQPLSGVLAKIMQRKEEAISRAARQSARPAAAKTPEQRVQHKPKLAAAAPAIEEDDGDLLLVDSDEDEVAAKKAAAGRAMAQEESQLFGLESQSLPDKPSLATCTTPAQTQPKPRTGLMSFMQRGPLMDSQDLFGSKSAAIKVPMAPSETVTGAATTEVADTEGPVLHLCLDTETQADQAVPTATCMQGEPGPEEQGTQHDAAKEEGLAEEGNGEEGEEEGAEEASASDSEGHAEDEGEGEEEEEFLSSDDSSSDEEEDAAAEEPLDSAGKQRALEEARALLRDKPQAKKKSAYFEDEAEMSEDGGHSDDGDSDGEEDEQDGILEDLIGLEKDGKYDEKRRAALHAAWLERQDEVAVEQLMHGVKNGFRRKRNALDDEGGTNYEAALRRAALMNTDDEGSNEAGSDSEEEARSEQADPFENIDALSDEEAKEELREAQQRRIMEESQKEEDNNVTLLDDESRAVLGLLQRGAASAVAPPPVLPLRPSNQSDLTNRPAKGSFLRRGFSTNPMAALTKSGSQMGITRSFVFGCENSNSGVPAADSQQQGSGSQAPTASGPTSFAGMHVGSSAAGIRPGTASAAEGPSNLLGMLHTKMHRNASSSAETEKAAAMVQMRSIMSGKKARRTLARNP